MVEVTSFMFGCFFTVTLLKVVVTFLRNDDNKDEEKDEDKKKR